MKRREQRGRSTLHLTAEIDYIFIDIVCLSVCVRGIILLLFITVYHFLFGDTSHAARCVTCINHRAGFGIDKPYKSRGSITKGRSGKEKARLSF